MKILLVIAAVIGLVAATNNTTQAGNTLAQDISSVVNNTETLAENIVGGAVQLADNLANATTNVVKSVVDTGANAIESGFSFFENMFIPFFG